MSSGGAVRQAHRKRLDNGSLYVLEALVTAASLRNELERRVSRQKHEESKATRLGSEADCRAQVIVECADTTSFLTPPLAGIFLPTNSDN